nr:hypothetical protein [Actinosynnema pretiosum]
MARPVAFRDSRATRKLIEATGEHSALLCDGEKAYGLGEVSPD